MLPIRRAAGVVLSLVLCLGSVARAQCVSPLAGMGPVNPVNGSPAHYVDCIGLALHPCLDFVCDPALALPNPNLPVSFPTNFPGEFFYFRGISDVTSGLIKGRLIVALEGSFLNGAVVPGDQIVFSRVRVRV